jgi:hypothetical protein
MRLGSLVTGHLYFSICPSIHPRVMVFLQQANVRRSLSVDCCCKFRHRCGLPYSLLLLHSLLFLAHFSGLTIWIYIGFPRIHFALPCQFKCFLASSPENPFQLSFPDLIACFDIDTHTPEILIQSMISSRHWIFCEEPQSILYL